MGIWFDRSYNFEFHVKKIIEKAYAVFIRSRFFCQKVCGPDSHTISLIYSSIITPIITYASSIYIGAFFNKRIVASRCLKKIRAFHASCCKSIAKSYSTVSFVNCYLLSGPLSLEY